MTSDAGGGNDRVVAAKVVLLGDGGTGKTTFVKRFSDASQHGNDDVHYEPTIGVHVHPITFQTSVGQPLRFLCWDTSGQEQFGSSRDAYYRGAECAILFFDVLARVTYKNCPLWYRDLKRVEPDAHVVLVGNKVDVARRQVKPKHVLFHRKVAVPYIEMSAKGNYNVEKPFLHFARSLLNDQTVELLEGTAVVAPEVEINLALLTESSHEPEYLDHSDQAADSDGSNDQ